MYESKVFENNMSSLNPTVCESWNVCTLTGLAQFMIMSATERERHRKKVRDSVHEKQGIAK